MPASRVNGPTHESIVLLCDADDLYGYHRAFSRRFQTHLIPPRRPGFWIEELHALQPLLVLNPDTWPWVPIGLQHIDAVTACFQIDTFVQTGERIRRSLLYDYVFVFHPEYERIFREAGHPGARLLPHAAEHSLFDGEDLERVYDVGWVGHTGWPIYRVRDRVLRELAARFITNDFARPYSPEEMASIYKRSKVVVNIGRDDYPQDANMRCFEAMAAGALLVTGMPSELTALGFVEGTHFVGYSTPDEVAAIVLWFLRHPGARAAIAGRARRLVLGEHTYDARVASIIHVVRNGQRLAPARLWSPIELRERYGQHSWTPSTR